MAAASSSTGCVKSLNTIRVEWIVAFFCDPREKVFGKVLRSMGVVLFGLFLTCRAFGSCPRERLFGYPDPKELSSWLVQEAKRYPGRMQVFSLGQSVRGHPLTLAVVGSGRDKEAILINGAHHGDEKITVLVALGFVDFLNKNFDHPEVKALLGRYQFVVLPLVNPDGYCAHSRLNAQGIDINRDYLSPSEDAAGDSGFKTPEARLIRDLVAKKRFLGALALHSGDEAVYWPLGDSPRPSNHHAVFEDLARSTAARMGFVRSMQSYFDYPTQGEFIDYVYRKYQILGLTVEVSRDHLPQAGRHRGIITQGIDGILSYVASLGTRRDGAKSPF